MAYFLEDYKFAAKYPFSAKAKDIMREQSVETNDDMAERGFVRLSAALNGEIPGKDVLHSEDGINEIIGYAAARMILSHMRNRFLSSKYAVAESKRAFAYLNNDTDENILALARDLGINSILTQGEKITVDISDFLLYAPRDVHWKLISRELDHGRVPINKHEEIRLVSEAVKKYAERIPATQSVPPSIKKFAEKLHEMLPKIEPQKISFKEGENPPCIEAILDLMKKHDNVGHTGRWLLAVYLINRGMGNEDIVKIFSNAPDFNERTTLYQIEHARKRGYTMPRCTSVVGYGYCVADCRINNPLNWRGKSVHVKVKVKIDGQ